MLERLFGSASRSKIIKFFSLHVSEEFYMRELARLLDIKLNALSRELENLEELGFLRSSIEQNKKYYETNPDFPMRQELVSIISKTAVLLEGAIVPELRKVRGIQQVLLTGLFVGEETETDVLIIGSVDRVKIQRIISGLSRSFFQEIHFTIFTPQEF